MVIESEIKQEKPKSKAGRKPLYGADVSVTRRQIRLPDETWDVIKDMYPDFDFSMAIRELVREHHA